MLEPLKIRDYRRLFTAQVFSDFGNWVEFIALKILIVYRWGLEADALAGFFICVCLPYVLFGPFFGVWTDMVDRRKVMVASDFLRMCLLISFMFVPNLYVLLALVFIKGTLTTMFNSAKQGSIRQVVPEEHLLQASSLSQTSVNLSKFIGPIAGGVFLLVLTIQQVFFIGAACFLISALCLLRLPALVHSAEEKRKQGGYLTELKFGLKYIPSNKLLLAVTVFFVVECLAMYAFEPQISLLTKSVGFDEQLYPTFVSIIGLGSVLGATMIGKWGKRVSPFTLLLIGTSVLGPGLLLLAASGFGILPVMYPLWILFFLIVGLGIGTLGVCYGYLLQVATPPEYMGRIAGTFESVVYLGILGGTLVGGAIADGFGVEMVFAYAGVFLFALGIAFKLMTSYLRISSVQPTIEQTGIKG